MHACLRTKTGSALAVTCDRPVRRLRTRPTVSNVQRATDRAQLTRRDARPTSERMPAEFRSAQRACVYRSRHRSRERTVRLSRVAHRLVHLRRAGADVITASVQLA